MFARLATAAFVVVLVVAQGDRFAGGPAPFVLAVAGIFVPFLCFQAWVASRPRASPVLKGVVVATDVGVVTAFTWLFPELRGLAPYAYLFVVTLTATLAGTSATLLGVAFAAAGSFVAWPAALASPLHRGGFLLLIVSIALQMDHIGRQRKQATNAARENGRRLEEAQALAHVGSWHWDVRRDVVTCSDELFRIFGYRRGGATGTIADVMAHVHPADRERVGRILREAVAAGRPFVYENRILHRRGEERIVLSRGRAVLDTNGAVVAMVGTAQDVTEQRRAEAAIQQALVREREAAEHLRTLNEMKSSFLTAVSHELRTPLTAILGFAQILDGGLLDSRERERELLRRVKVNAEKLERLLADLLDIDRLERGILEPKRRPEDLSAIVRRVVDEQQLDRRRPLTLDLVPVVIAIDAAKVERIVENLVANALKHTQPGTPIWVGVSPTREGGLLVVEDAGSGVPAELRAAIFEPFRQGRSLSHSPGVGIGLSLVARFAELHGGRAWVEERRGGGASFRVLLPASAGPRLDSEPDATDAAPDQAPSAARAV